MKTMFDSATYEKRKLKAKFRKDFSLSSNEANALVEECRFINHRIHEIACKSFGSEALTKTEVNYMDSLPLNEELKSKLWQGAMFAQFR